MILTKFESMSEALLVELMNAREEFELQPYSGMQTYNQNKMAYKSKFSHFNDICSTDFQSMKKFLSIADLPEIYNLMPFLHQVHEIVSTMTSDTISRLTPDDTALVVASASRSPTVYVTFGDFKKANELIEPLQPTDVYHFLNQEWGKAKDVTSQQTI